MLLEKPPAEGDIVSFKLTNGEEIVGKLVKTSANGVTVSRPVAIAVQMVGPQKASLAFAPFMASITDDQNVTFTTALLQTTAMKTRTDVANNYRLATTGIEVPTAQQSPGLLSL